MSLIKRRYFTLVELLVTVGILMFLVVILSTFFSSANRLWKATEQSTNINNEAQLIFDITERLFDGAIISSANIGMIFDAMAFEVDHSENNPYPSDFTATSGLDLYPFAYELDDYVPENQYLYANAAIFATVSDMEIGLDASSSFYIVGLMHTIDDKLMLRTISDEYLSEDENMTDIFDEMKNNREDFLERFRAEEDEWTTEDGHLSLEVARNVTKFVIYPAVLITGTTDKLKDERMNQLGLQIMAPVDPSTWEIETNSNPYAVKVEFSLLSPENYNTWLQLWPDRTTDDSSEEPDAAKRYRALHEKTYSRLIYLGPKREVTAP